MFSAKNIFLKNDFSDTILRQDPFYVKINEAFIYLLQVLFFLNKQNGGAPITGSIQLQGYCTIILGEVVPQSLAFSQKIK
jgi:hypothetical protein